MEEALPDVLNSKRLQEETIVLQCAVLVHSILPRTPATEAIVAIYPLALLDRLINSGLRDLEPDE